MKEQTFFRQWRYRIAVMQLTACDQPVSDEKVE